MLVFVAMLFILVCKGTCQFQSISDCHSIDYPVSSFEIHCRVVFEYLGFRLPVSKSTAATYFYVLGFLGGWVFVACCFCVTQEPQRISRPLDQVESTNRNPVVIKASLILQGGAPGEGERGRPADLTFWHFQNTFPKS